jgi:hypothetical protein
VRGADAPRHPVCPTITIGVQSKGQRLAKHAWILSWTTPGGRAQGRGGIPPLYVAQILSYLKATRLRLGLLISFNVTTLRHGIKRVIYTA